MATFLDLASKHVQQLFFSSPTSNIQLQKNTLQVLPVEVLGELGLFLASLVFLILTFASSLSALEHGSWAFSGLPRAALSLWELSLGMISSNQLESLGQGAQTPAD